MKSVRLAVVTRSPATIWDQALGATCGWKFDGPLLGEADAPQHKTEKTERLLEL
jgi:hypothetical protein